MAVMRHDRIHLAKNLHICNIYLLNVFIGLDGSLGSLIPCLLKARIKKTYVADGTSFLTVYAVLEMLSFTLVQVDEIHGCILSRQFE